MKEMHNRWHNIALTSQHFDSSTTQVLIASSRLYIFFPLNFAVEFNHVQFVAKYFDFDLINLFYMIFNFTIVNFKKNMAIFRIVIVRDRDSGKPNSGQGWPLFSFPPPPPAPGNCNVYCTIIHSKSIWFSRQGLHLIFIWHFRFLVRLDRRNRTILNHLI